ncbi:hypothetical protein ABVT39_012498, partial [Epinephelus coioides]
MPNHLHHQPDLNTFSGTLQCGGNANHTDYQEFFYPDLTEFCGFLDLVIVGYTEHCRCQNSCVATTVW